MINYLFSSINKNNGFNNNQKKYLLKNINNNMNIAFISSLPNDYNRTDNQIKHYIQCFTNIGISFNNVYFLDNRIPKKRATSLIKNSDVIFLMGGSPELQMLYIKENNLINAIKDVKIVIGVSAGAMNQGDRIIFKDDFDNNIIKDYKGLCLTSLNIFPHYDENNSDILSEVNIISEIHKIICLPNESFIYIDNKNIEFVGDYYIK